METGRIITAGSYAFDEGSRLVYRVIFVSLLLFTAGCIGGGTESMVSYTAEPVQIEDAAISDSPFSVSAERTIQFNQSIALGGGSEQRVQLRVGMVQAQQDDPAVPVSAQLVVLSVPDVTVADNTVSIADQFDPLTVIAQSNRVPSRVERDRKVGEREATILGGERTVSIYQGRKSQSGSESNVLIYESSFQHATDTIVIVGFVPRGNTETRDALWMLLRHITHQ